jgi:hypothetical protein
MWVTSIGGCRCYSSRYSLSLAHVLSFGLLRRLGCFEGVSFELSFFPFLIDVFSTANFVVCLTFVCWILMGRLFCFEIGSWCLATLLFGWLRCFSGALGVRGALLICSEVWWADHF